MGVIRKLLKLLRNIVVTLVVLVIVLVVAFIAINSKDQPPSETALQFQQAWDNRKPVDAADNGYIYLAGLDAATDETPDVVGAKRIQLLNDIAKGSAADNPDFFRAEYNPEDAFIKEVKTAFDQCGKITKDCIEAIEKNKSRIIEWSQAEDLIGKRYAQLISHQYWLEPALLDASFRIPQFGLVMKAQRLAFMREIAAMEPDKVNRVVELLDADLRFWRMALENTDMLIGKMIAVAAIKNNFLWTNQFLLKMKNTPQPAPVLFALNQPFTDAELSMRRSLIGEWIFAHSVTNPLDGSEIDNVTGKYLLKFSYQKQDTLNNRAASLNSVTTELDVPLANFETTLKSYQQKIRPEKSFTYYLLHPYNIVGQILGDVAPPSMYTDYVIRTKDLEAFRRGLLASIEYMNNESGANTKYTSPYKTKPFVINQEQRSITVNGLGKDRNAQMIYSY